jgi:hypothetical protein
MRTIGNLLMALGALIGMLVAVTMMTGVSLPGLPWLIIVGFVKLTLIASGGLIAAGGVCLRLANRAEERKRLAPSDARPPGEQLLP